MKILAIRGAGLASLAEPFAIDLGGGALGRAGVFAIVGPTGAGKSTLLDALFLALFGETPRLSSQPRTAVARAKDDDLRDEAFTARDPRSLARSDVDHAYAEVDFRGVDGATYRARWDLTRKRPQRGAPSPWRKAEHALTRLGSLDPMGAGQRLGGTKTEVLGHIEARLGLDFHEFRRSVVLAQGEIAAFLHAPDRDRAELLERMTGTEIYGELSKEIHFETVRQRARQEQIEAQIDMQLGAPLDEAARASLGRAFAAARVEALEAERRRREAEHALAMGRTALELTEEAEHAEAEVQRLRSQVERAESHRGDLEAHARVMDLWPRIAAFDRACTEERDSQARAREASAQTGATRERARATHAALEKADEARTEAQHHLDEATAAVNAARIRREAARPLEMDAARREARYAELEAARREATAEKARAEGELAAAREAIARWDERLADAPGLDRVLSRAGAGDPGFTPEDLAARAAHLGERKEEAEARAAESLADQRRALEEDARTQRILAAAEESASAVVTRTQRAAARLAEVLKEAERVLERAPTPSDALPVRAHEDQRGARSPFLGRLVARGEVGTRVARRSSRETSGELALETSTEASPQHGVQMRPARTIAALDPDLRAHAAPLLARAATCRATLLAAAARTERQAAQAREKAELSRRARRENAQLRTELLRFAAELSQSQAQLEEADARWAQAEARVKDLARAAYAHALRAELVAGQACEVCGATDHPRAPDPSEPLPEEEAIRAARAALDDARSRRDELGARTLALRSAYALLSRQVPSRDPQLVVALSPPPSLEALTSLVAGLEAARVQVETRHADLLEAMGRSTQAEKQAAAALGERERARRTLEDVTHRVTLIERERSELAEAEAALGLSVILDTEKRARSRERAGRARDADLLGFLRVIVEERSEAHRAMARLEVLKDQATRASHQSALADREAARAHEEARAARERAQAFADAAAACDAATEHEARARTACDRARQAREERERAHREAERQVHVADAAASHTTEGRRTAEARCRALATELLTALRDAGLSKARDDERADDPQAELAAGLTVARRWAARSSEEMESLRRALIELDAARRDAEAVLAERKRRRAAHLEREGAPGTDAEPLDAARLRALLGQRGAEVEACRALENQTKDTLARAHEAIRADDALRAELAARRAEHEAQSRELAVWEALEAALGSADGRKLRVYAQRLTLRTLVREASHHLATLAPRYAIEAVPGGDLAIQVRDRALFGEVRAIGALSGGETFLVSLALALALRGMAANRVRIETLFIDEGFGALDAASLDVVLSALDALEASGRQVGIVSHVPEVKERFAARVEILPEPSSRGGGTSRVRIAV